MMKKRRLGRTDIEITSIGLGTWQLSEGRGFSKYFWPVLSQDVVDGIIKAAVDGGINWFDTAEIYGNGRSEKDLSAALVKAGIDNGEVIIATKWWPVFRTARSIGATIDVRLKCLSPFSIDLYQIHNPYSFASVEAQMNAMADLVEAGKIRAVGVSNFSAKMMRKAHDVLTRRGIPLASNQVRYNILGRGPETNGVLETAKELGITIICYSPLEFGLLTGKFHRDPELLQSRPFARRKIMAQRIESSMPIIKVLENIAEAHGATVSQVALSWLVNFNGDMIVAIPGASKPKHAEESAGAMKIALSSEEVERIDHISRVR
jgi:aryl-alcohol dehydrogenase-like predicted oxidoreductase